MDMEPSIFIDAFNLLLALAGVVLWGYAVIGDRRKLMYGLSVIVWLVHGCVFYVSVLIYRVFVFSGPITNVDFFMFWSRILRMQGFLVALGYGIVLAFPKISNMLRSRADGEH